MNDWIKTRCESANSCIEVRCETGNCVEVSAIGRETVALRSTLAPDDVWRVTREEWAAFVEAVKAGQFDAL
jgi:hypothetical protein